MILQWKKSGSGIVIQTFGLNAIGRLSLSLLLRIQHKTTPESTITPLEPEQTLPKPTAPDSTQDLETVPESGTTPESTITPLEPEQTLPKPTAPDSTQDVPESASTTPESTITPLEPELEILPVSPPEPELEILPVSPPEPELEILPITQ